MNADRWQQIDGLFQAAVELEPGRRAAFLDEACSGDETVRSEVESLLATDSREWDLIERPALEAAASLLADEQPQLAPSQTFGHYEIVNLIGRGGMGEVYLAKDQRLNRRIALKLLASDYTAYKDRLRRFQQEAQAASALNHPNILTIHELGEVDAQQFIATEFVEGETLRQRMKRAGLSIGEVLDVAVQATSALSAAHKAGIVHRDIKPENIMLRPDGYVKVLDFGLAKLTEQKEQTIDSRAVDNVDGSSGLLMGTVKYMSPEQAQGLTVDARSDIFSFGVVLYEMIAGQPPFKGETSNDLIASLLNEEPPPIAQHSPGIPEELPRIVRKALSKDRAKRYQTVDEVLSDLKSLKDELELESRHQRRSKFVSGNRTQMLVTESQALDGAVTGPGTSDSEARPTRSTAEYLASEISRHKGAFGLVLALAVAMLAVTALIFRFSLRAAPKLAESRFQRTKFSRLTTSGNNLPAVISPDGKYVAYIVNANGKQSLWLRVIANSSDLQILPPDDAIYQGMAISPDSQMIYFDKTRDFGNSSGIYRIPLLGGVEKKLLNGTSGPPVSFSPDGKSFAFVRWNADEGSDDVWLANEDGTEARRLASRKLEGPGDTCSPAWSPDGKLIVCPWGVAADNSMNLFEISVHDGTTSPMLNEKWDEVGQAVWLPDGSGLFITARERGSELFQIWLVSYPRGEVRRITNDINNYRFISLTSDSSMLAAVQIDRQSNIWVAPVGDTGNAKQITFKNYDGDNDQGLSWTVGGQLVYATRAGGKSEIWIMDEDGSNQRKLTDDSSSNYMPAVTPDGRYIIFVSDRGGGKPHLWRMDIDGGNPKQLTNGPIEFLPQISPDGKWVVYHSYTSGVTTLWRTPVDGGESVLLTDRVLDTYSSVSPDGKFVSCLYLDEHDGKKDWKIAVVPFEGGPPVKLFDVRPSPISFAPLPWTNDGKSLMYLDKKNGISNIMQLTIESGESRQMTNFTSDRIFYFDWSIDGKRLAIARGKVNQDVVLISDAK